MLYDRLEKAEDKIHELEKTDVDHKYSAESVREQTVRQWEMLGNHTTTIGEIKGRMDGLEDDVDRRVRDLETQMSLMFKGD